MSIFCLKICALLAMTLDHLGVYLPDIFPVGVRWIGRIAGPIFLFCFASSLHYTSSRVKLLIRIYCASAVVSIVNLILIYSVGNDKYIISNIFPVFFVIGMFVYLWEREYTKKKYKYFAVAGFYILQSVFGLICLLPFIEKLMKNQDVNLITSKMLNFTGLLPNYMTCESGFQWVILGLLLYAFWDTKKKQVIVISVYSALLLLLNFVTGFTLHNIFYVNYEWMQFIAIFFLIKYNGTKGKGLKKLFYIYYPVHIWILYLIACTNVL